MALRSDHSTHAADRRRAGFSTVEMLVVMVILAILGTIGTVAYTTYMTQIKNDLSTRQKGNVIEHIDTTVDLISKGVDSGLTLPGTNMRITSESTCAEFLEGLKASTAAMRNPYDGSPAITFSTDYERFQKRGKVRITCYKLHKMTASNGGSCKMSEAGILVTHFKYNCGGSCNSPLCTYPGSDCGNGPVINGWTYGAQTEKYYGKVEARFVKSDNGTVRRYSNGDAMIDVKYGRAVCPGFSIERIPKEADY